MRMPKGYFRNRWVLVGAILRVEPDENVTWKLFNIAQVVHGSAGLVKVEGKREAGSCRSWSVTLQGLASLPLYGGETSGGQHGYNDPKLTRVTPRGELYNCMPWGSFRPVFFVGRSRLEKEKGYI